MLTENRQQLAALASWDCKGRLRCSAGASRHGPQLCRYAGIDARRTGRTRTRAGHHVTDAVRAGPM